MVPINRIQHLWPDPSPLDLPAGSPARRTPPPSVRPRLRPEEIRLHAVLSERLTARQATRRGLWSRIWRWVWGGP